MSSTHEALKDVEAYIFDVFGTVVDWYGNITEQLAAAAPEGGNEDWDAFATEWRTGYFKHAQHVSGGGEGATNMDVAHRQVLDAMLKSDRWKHLSSHWDDAKRQGLVMSWHKAQGWPDSTKGLYALKKNHIVAALSNGNIRFLVDLAKNADLPWDVVLSVDLFGTCKPSPRVYQGALHHLSLPGERCAMVAAHLWDLRAAAKHGMKTVYVPRPTDDLEDRDHVKCKAEGGEVDVVVGSLEELAALL
ncbi:haloacid dehalogenase [Dichomitus squalens LYAD-421 SS1]|uniref:Haloacid dehalogenase n=1 Tax=Dichomitus squalens (strain LYAD-421) TaxID=732165 RepID=R7SWH5_DICSQ|nr:haloacid dehalogenase [Dichomitus squalens LYAD-421 SS1]EJF60431.1 haloacid dehalogenase [Dichomitus squalens LYAD-421 SS1]